MKALTLLAIRLYQRHLSPRKGYRCAYRMHTGRASCSALGYRAIRRHGPWHGYALLRHRLERCSAAHHHAAARAPGRQAGFCDLPCDGADAAGACDLLSSSADCGSCGGGREVRRQRQEEIEVRIRSRKVLGGRNE